MMNIKVRTVITTTKGTRSNWETFNSKKQLHEWGNANY